jgi:hypothetical protein
MASIEQSPGTLDISYMRKGYAFAFQTIHDGDITADTFDATIYNDDGTFIVLTVGKSYNGTSLKTTISYNLTAVNSALLQLGTQRWEMVQTTSAVPRVMLAGAWGVYDGSR